MATYTVNSTSAQILGSGADDIIVYKPSFADETFYGTIDGGAGTDTLDLVPADDPLPTAEGAVTRLFTAGAPVFGIERLRFGTATGQVFAFQTSLGSTPAGTVIEGGAGIDRLTLVGQGTTIAMPDLILTNWSANDEVTLVAAYSGTRHNLIARNNFGGVQHLVAYEAFSTLNGSNGRDILELANSYQTLRGNAGDDVMLLLQSSYGALTNATIDGGLGTDTLTVRGPVTLARSTLTSIEALRLEPLTYTDALPDVETVSVPADLTTDTSVLGEHPYLALSGTGHISLTMLGTVFDATSLTFAAGTAIDFTITGSAGDDRVYGSASDEIVYGGAGDDTLLGAGGDDILYGGDGSDHLGGGAGTDKLYGGAGDDYYFVTDATDQVVEGANGGTDLVSTMVDYVLGANVENLVVKNAAGLTATGNGLANLIIGDAGADRLSGLDGNDTLFGKGGADVLTGGAGRDVFKFQVQTDSSVAKSDHITDFSAEDEIDLFYLDGDTTQAGQQPLIWIGTAGFSHFAGEFRYSVVSGNAVVQADTNGDGQADFQIILDGVTSLTKFDFRTIAVSAKIDSDLGNTIQGTSGIDYIQGRGGDDIIFGGAGADFLSGGAGADTFTYQSGDARTDELDHIVDFNSSEGDRIAFTMDADATLPGVSPFHWIGNAAFSGVAGELRYRVVGGDAYVEGDTNGDGITDKRIILDGVTSLSESDFLLRPIRAPLVGTDAGESLFGNDGDGPISGLGGNDKLVGRGGLDILTGGTGADIFRYDLVTDSTRFAPDHITDFNPTEGDIIDLTLIDGDSTTLPDNGFDWIGTAAFSHTPGELRYEVSGGNTTLQGDINGDGLADLAIVLDGVTALDQSSILTRAKIFVNLATGQAVGTSLADDIFGGTGNNELLGLAGADFLYGGVGKDIFRYDTVTHSQPGAADQIFNFNPAESDKIDLTRIDAKYSTGDNDAFNWIGAAGFHNVAGELRYETAGSNVVIQGDSDGNGIADLEIIVRGMTSFDKSYILL